MNIYPRAQLMKNFLFSSFLIFGLIISSHAQDYNWRMQYDTCIINYNNGKIELAQQWLEKALSDYKMSGTDSTEYFSMVNLLARCYLKTGKNFEAEELFKKDIEYFKNNQSEVSKQGYVTSIIFLGYSYYNTRRFKEAKKYFTEALTLKASNPKSPQYIIILNNLATIANIAKSYQEADSLYKAVLGLKKEVYGVNHIEYANTLTSLGNLYKKMGRFAEAEPLYAQSIAIRKVATGEKNPEYINALNNMATLYNLQGRYQDAEPLYRRIMELSKQIYSSDKIEYTKSITNLAGLYKTMSRFNESEALYTEVLTIRQQTIGEHNLDYASALINLATLYKSMSEYNKAEIYYLSALSTYEVIIGEYHESYVAALINLASLYRTMGRLQEAEPLYTKALKIYKLTSGSKTIPYANLLNNIALYFDEVGRYEQAEEYYKKALEITQELLGDNHPDFATTLNNLALLYKNTGHFEQAEPIYKQSAKIRKETLGEKHPEYAASLNNLASLYENMGRNDEAEPLFKQALSIIKDSYGKQNHYYASTLNNLAGLYEIEKKYDQAEELYNESLEIIRLTLGEKHPDYATTLNNLALLQQNRKDYKKAEELYIKNLQKTKEAFTERHPNYATALSNLAGLYEHMGNYLKAEKMYSDALKIRGEILGDKHPSYTLTLSCLARLYTAIHRYDMADSLWERTLNNYLYEIQSYFPSMSEKEKGQFYHTISPDFEQFNSYVLMRATENPAMVARMYDNQLATKALLLNSSNKLRQRILSSADTALINMYKTWLSQKEYLSKIYSLTKEEIRRMGIDADSIETATNDLEKKLSLKSELFKNTNDIQYYSWKDVQKELKEGEAALELIRFQKYTFDSAGVYSDSIYYAALIVKKNTQNSPELVLIKDGAELESKYVHYYKNAVKFKHEDPYSYDKFWKAIHIALDGVKKLYFSPDGAYNQININSLLNEESKKYVFDEIELQNVTNTKDLVARRIQKTSKKQIVLFGNPDYALDESTHHTNELYANLLNQLPGTEEEVKKINKTMAQNSWSPKMFTGDDATEKNIKNLNNPKVLHVATHGFFEKDLVASNENDQEKDKVKENPLLRSGLMLAGASVTLYNRNNTIFNAQKIEANYEDGILTAYEAMNLNLDNTELVVLSACETGQGEVKNGEGVYGLQRAFVIAGAKSIIISLWKVNDETTQKLMSSFYLEWIKTGNKTLAFRNAQLSLKKEFPDPYYWGAFVMVGE
jgi:CHAT domain-containing protein/Tfp pilus assembly protein PilF